MAKVLPLPHEQQEAWLYHMQRIWELRQGAERHVRAEVEDRRVEEIVEGIKQAHGVATFARDPAVAKTLYRQVRTSAELLLPGVNLERDPINYIELCFLMHEALSVLNRNDEGLWYGKRARWVAESIDDPRRYHIDQERLDHMVVNAIRAEAVADHNLKLFRAALERCEAAERTDALGRDPDLWKPHLYRDMINALEGIPRFPITRAENLADQVRDICDTRGHESDGMLSFLIQASLARAYVRHRNFKDACGVLSTGLDHLHRTRNLGPLHQVIFLRTFARFYSVQRAYGSDWSYLIREATRIASLAGLEHQLNEMREEFGVHLYGAEYAERSPRAGD